MSDDYDSNDDDSGSSDGGLFGWAMMLAWMNNDDIDEPFYKRVFYYWTKLWVLGFKLSFILFCIFLVLWVVRYLVACF